MYNKVQGKTRTITFAELVKCLIALVPCDAMAELLRNPHPGTDWCRDDSSGLDSGAMAKQSPSSWAAFSTDMAQ